VKLHIGGTEPKEGWRILNIQPGPHVDIIGSCTDLSQFQDNIFSEIYASHVLEHLSHRDELERAIFECYRILEPNSELKISVPDMATICRLFDSDNITVEERYDLMLMMFGGHVDEHDIHLVGIWEEFLIHHLKKAGFKSFKKVPLFGMFNDFSKYRFAGELISLNMIAVK